MSCHSEWIAFYTNDDWANAGQIIKGDSFNSKLIYKLVNEGGDMPPSGAPITDSDVQILKDWIDSL